jgi:hypothetical protein
MSAMHLHAIETTFVAKIRSLAPHLHDVFDLRHSQRSRSVER